jgi:type IV secretion system protein TrbL
MGCSINPAQWGDCVGEVAGKAAGDAFHQIAQDFGHTAEHVTGWLWGQISAATALQIGGPAWTTPWEITGAIAGIVGLGLLVIQVGASALRQDFRGIGRAVRGVVVAFVGAAFALSVLKALLVATDQLSNGVMQLGLGTTNWQQAGALLLGATVLSALSDAALLVVALGMIGATVIVWLALMVRKLLLIITAVFAPLAFAGFLAEITSSWVRRWIEMTVALVFSKLILVIVFVVGLDVMDDGLGQSGTGVTQTVTQIATGLLILCVAGLAPWLALKMVHFAGESFHQIHAHGQAAVSGAQAAVAAPRKLQSVGQRFGSGQSAHQGPQGQHGQQSSRRTGQSGTGTGGEAAGPGSGQAGGGAAGPAGTAVVAGDMAKDKVVDGTKQTAGNAQQVAETTDGQRQRAGSSRRQPPEEPSPSGPAAQHQSSPPPRSDGNSQSPPPAARPSPPAASKPQPAAAKGASDV